MEANRLYSDARKGIAILEAFEKIGITTTYRVNVLLELHEARQKGGKVTRPALRKAIGSPHNSLFSTSVLNPLVKDGYIKITRAPGGYRFVSITSTGEGLVDTVMESAGYL